jgi:hypothetical protein
MVAQDPWKEVASWSMRSDTTAACSASSAIAVLWPLEELDAFGF